MTGSDSATLLGTLAPTTSPTMRPLGLGDVLGRYLVLDPIGAGGMGAVHVAYDPELDRKVAIKILRVSDDAFGSGGREVLLAEARAMAKLNHTNVVAVYDVGDHNGRIYIAMELVKGRTLRRWCEDETPSWREVVRVYSEAGKGLAAAHAEGLVHRDFKPDNVMLGEDARVRVMDFGIALPLNLETSGVADSAQDGRVAGTPAYMSPEQHGGRPVGAASDQFSFCVAVWEALYGSRPFGGATAAEVATNVVSGDRQAVVSGRKIPRWLREILDTGLALEPGDRFPDMNRLLDVLRRAERGRRYRILAAGLSVPLLAAGGTAVHQRYLEAQQLEGCRNEAAAIESTWNAERNREIHEALVATGRSYAAESAARVTPVLDDYAARWETVRMGVCVGSTQSELNDEQYQRATWCLEQREAEFAALIQAIEEDGSGALGEVAHVAASLGRIETCEDEGLLARLPLPPAESRPALVDLNRRMVGIASRFAPLGSSTHAEAMEVISEAESLGWAPIEAQAHAELGMMLRAATRYEEAEAELESAVFLWLDADSQIDAANVAYGLSSMTGGELRRAKDARRWIRIADSLAHGMPDALDLTQAKSALLWGLILYRQGQSREAIPHLEEALRIYEVALGPKHPGLASPLAALGAAHWTLEETERASVYIQRSLEITTRAFGPDHPKVGSVLNNLAELEMQRGDYETASRRHAEVLELREAAFGRESAFVARSHHNLAEALMRVGRVDEAVSHWQESVALFSATLGPDHPDVGTPLTSMGVHLLDVGEGEEARKVLARAVRVWSKVDTPHNSKLARSLRNLARAEALLGNHAEALARVQEAVALYAQDPERMPADFVLALALQSEVLLALGNVDEARHAAERAIEVASSDSGLDESLAWARFALARVLAGAPAGQERARLLVQQGVEALRGIPTAGAKVARIEAWLTEHPLLR